MKRRREFTLNLNCSLYLIKTNLSKNVDERDDNNIKTDKKNQRSTLHIFIPQKIPILAPKRHFPIGTGHGHAWLMFPKNWNFEFFSYCKVPFPHWLVPLTCLACAVFLSVA